MLSPTQQGQGGTRQTPVTRTQAPTHTPPPSGRDGSPPKTPGGNPAARVARGAQSPFSGARPRSQAPGQRGTAAPYLGQSKSAPALQQLFNGHPPPVHRSQKSNGGSRFEFTAPENVQTLHQPLATVCKDWFAQPQSVADGIALIDALCKLPQAATLWHALLSRHGEALARAKRDAPVQDILRWVRRLKAVADAALDAQDTVRASEALGWAQDLVQGFPIQAKGPAAKALALVNQGLKRLNMAQAHKPDLVPPPFRLDTDTDTPPATPRQSLRPARASLPPFHDIPADSELDRALMWAVQTAGDDKNFVPLLHALQAWQACLWEGKPSPYGDRAQCQALRGLLGLCENPWLSAAQRAELLELAWSVVGPQPPHDSLLAHDVAEAIRRWLPADRAAHLLLAHGVPPEQLHPDHPYRRRLDAVRELIDWGLPEAAARQLLRDSRYAWAHQHLFHSQSPGVHCHGEGVTLTFQPVARDFNDADVDAVLVVCEAWQDQCPGLALALMKTTTPQALNAERESALLQRWHRQATVLQARTKRLENAPAIPLPKVTRKVFAPWLSVAFDIDPQSGRTTAVHCTVQRESTLRLPPQVLLRVREKLLGWGNTQLHDPSGLSFDLLVKVFETVDTELDGRMALEPEDWLQMTLMECQRTGTALRLITLLPSLPAGTLDEASLAQVFQVAARPELDPGERANVIQNALSCLPPRDGPGAMSHADCLLSILAHEDASLRRNLFRRYCSHHPFDPSRDPTPQLFELLSRLRESEGQQDSDTWAQLVQPGPATAWPLWRALCLRLITLMAPRIRGAQLAAPDLHSALEANTQVLYAVHRLSWLPEQAALSAERQATLLSALCDAMPLAHRRSFLEQLDVACLDLMRQALAMRTGERLSGLIALRGALLALSGPSVPGQRLANTGEADIDAGVRFFAEWFAVRLAPHRGASDEREALKALKLQYELSRYSPETALSPRTPDPLEGLIRELFLLHGL